MMKRIYIFYALIFIFCAGFVLEKVFAEEKSQCDSLEKNTEKLFNDNALLFGEVISKEKEITSLKTQLDTLRQENANDKNSFEQLKESNADLERRMEELSSQLKNAEAKNKKIKPKDEVSARKRAHYNLGFIYAQKKELDKAIQEYKKVLAIDPEDKDAHFNLGYLYVLKEDFVSAVKEYEQVFAIDPSDKEVHYNLAIIYHRHLKDEDKAREHYQKFLQGLEE